MTIKQIIEQFDGKTKEQIIEILKKSKQINKLYAVNEYDYCIIEYEIYEETEKQYFIKKDAFYNKRIRKSEMYDKWNCEKFFETEEEAKKYLKDYTTQKIILNEEKIKRLTQQNIELKELLNKEQ